MQCLANLLLLTFDYFIIGTNAWRPPRFGSEFSKLAKCLYGRSYVSGINPKSVFESAKELELRLEELQLKEASNEGLTAEESLMIQECYSGLSSLLLQQECFWKQRARISWLAYSNTKFFHLNSFSN